MLLLLLRLRAGTGKAWRRLCGAGAGRLRAERQEAEQKKHSVRAASASGSETSAQKQESSQSRRAWLRAQAAGRLSSATEEQLGTLLRGTVDTGCSKLIIGDERLAEVDLALQKLHGLSVKWLYLPGKGRRFRYANGKESVSEWIAEIPTGLAGVHGLLRVNVVRGTCPLLISEGFMEDMGAQISLRRGKVWFEQISKTSQSITMRERYLNIFTTKNKYIYIYIYTYC